VGIKLKKMVTMSLFVALLGAAIGGITWLLLFFMNLGIDLIWTVIPARLEFLFYPVVVCALGGLLIGLYTRRFGPYPRELQEIMATVKKGDKLRYDNLPVVAVAALLPLFFGGSIGPEAGLTGVIVGLCFWFSDRFQFVFAEVEELAQIGMAATIGVIFGSPLFAFVHQIEDEKKPTVIPKNTKILMYFVGTMAGFGALNLLTGVFGGGMGLERFPGIEHVDGGEWLAAIPLALIGVAGGLLYYVFQRLVKVLVQPLKSYIIIKAVLGGIILGGVGILLPYTMFAGEHQMKLVMDSWQSTGFAVLLLTGLVKLLMGNICAELGWRGGNIFPTIFSGVTIGYALALLLPIDPIFCVAVVTSALTATVMRKPLAVILLLLICFPVNGIIPMTIGAVIGGAIPLPNWRKPASSSAE